MTQYTEPRIRAPLFRDGSFVFVPISWSRDLAGPRPITYADLQKMRVSNVRVRQNNLAIVTLLKQIEQCLRGFVIDRDLVHYDPNFDELTFGDWADQRGKQLAKLSEGDRLFFLTSLTPVNVNSLRGYLQIHQEYSAEMTKCVRRNLKAD